MAKLYKKGHAKAFYYRRAKRLLPAYFATIFFTLAAAAILTVPSDYAQVKQQGFFSITYASNIGFWLQNSYFSKAEFNPLLHLWSLGVEIQFYLIVPLIAFTLRKHKLAFGALALVSLILCLAVVTISPKTSFFMTPLRCWEFLLGFWAATAIKNKPDTPKTTPTNQKVQTLCLAILVCLPLIPISGQSLTILYGHPASFALLVTVTTAISLVLGLPQWLIRSIFGKALEKLGNYSYSIYLVHFPVIVLSNYEPFGGTILPPSSPLDSIIQLLLIGALSFLSYQLIEKKTSTKPLTLIAAGTLSIFVLSLLGSLFQETRFTQEQLQIFYTWEDRAPYRCGKLFRITNPRDRICPLSEDKQNKLKPVLLVGNSHADSIKKAFNATANELGYQTYFYVTNRPLMRESSITAQTVIGDAKKIGADKVVLHYSPKGVDIAELIRLSKLAVESEISVSVIASVPTYSYHIPKELYLSSKQESTPIEKTLRDYHYENKDELTELRAILGIKLIEPAPLVCTPQCKIKTLDGKLAYFDAEHLTLSGAWLLKNAYQKALSD